ncbi:MAG: polyhydroxyalkanoate synthesis repressor PhaR [Hyphomicrobiales bacterium]|nr:polyhydroxyalkanoate synthesis repressor PhaR [Hyphomicrobiales bacterium]
MAQKSAQDTTQEKPALVIKKYANRRLYNTGSSVYVTLEDLAGMVKRGEEFVVQDAKTSEDITRAVLTQIIFEQEGKTGQNLLPTNFLRQLIGFYGDQMQVIVPSYLEFTFSKLVGEQQKYRDQMAKFMIGGKLGEPTLPMFASLEEQARKNMSMFSQALAMLNPFAPPPATPAPPAPPDDLETMRRELSEMQRRLDKMGKS